MAITQETYMAAEKALIEWVDMCIKNGFDVPQIVFMLQFRIFDINMASREPLAQEEVKAGGTD